MNIVEALTQGAPRPIAPKPALKLVDFPASNDERHGSVEVTVELYETPRGPEYLPCKPVEGVWIADVEAVIEFDVNRHREIRIADVRTNYGRTLSGAIPTERWVEIVGAAMDAIHAEVTDIIKHWDEWS